MRRGRGGATAGILAFAAMLAGCNWVASEPPLQGYIEGTYVSVSPEDGGKIAELAVRRGERVSAGDLLFRLSSGEQEANVAEARARVAQAESLVAQAQSAFDAAEKSFRRAADLQRTNVVAQANLDSAKALHDEAQAALAAAERNLAATHAALDLAEVRLTRRTVTAPAAGTIEETFFEPGEFVAAAQPVVSLLPDGGRKVRFYVPEARILEFRPGTRVGIACDGCAEGLEAEVTFVATQAEYTPPVIYSVGNREKLVFRVEARPIAAARDLAIGLPVDVRPISGGGGAG
jgi:HlyD family secretion protein